MSVDRGSAAAAGRSPVAGCVAGCELPLERCRTKAKGFGIVQGLCDQRNEQTTGEATGTRMAEQDRHTVGREQTDLPRAAGSS